MKTITQADYDMLRQLMLIEGCRYERNPTTYFTNLFRRGMEIISEHIAEDAEPVDSEKRFISE